MGERSEPEDRPGAGDQSKPWNRKEFIDFLRSQNPELGELTGNELLAGLDEQTKKNIISQFETYDDLVDDIEKRAVVALENLHGDDLSLLRSLTQSSALLGREVAELTKKFRQQKISGDRLAARLGEAAIIAQFLQRQVQRLTEKTGGD